VKIFVGGVYIKNFLTNHLLKEFW